MHNSLRLSNDTYRHVFLTQNRNYWGACPFDYDKENDLVLTFDFAVVSAVQSAGGEAQYIDYLVARELLELYNYKTYDFFATWHINAVKQDIFKYKDVDVGSAFRLEIWNDITYYVRLIVSLRELIDKIKFNKIYIGMDDEVVWNIIKFLKIKTDKWSTSNDKVLTEYYFPIFRLMREAVFSRTFKYKMKVRAIQVQQTISEFFEKFTKQKKTTKYIYAERYYSTEHIIEKLIKTKGIKVIRSDFSTFTDMLSSLCLPTFFISGDANHESHARTLREKFEKEKTAKLFVGDIDISEEINKLIINRIGPLIARNLKIVEVIIDFFASRKLSLMVTFSSLGAVNRLMINYCKSNNIPVYMIINGILANSFLDEAKEGTWTNSYSESIKTNYFSGIDNIVCLGDPRMDKYYMNRSSRGKGFSKLVLGIGTSLFSNVDLNSYLAVEFDFLNDIMMACKVLREKGKEIEIIIKLRANNYLEQYQSFLDEYYPNVPVTIFKNIPMNTVFDKIDLYISLASQTLFEASCLNIPVIYYKNDTHYYHTPFDGESELVTAYTQEDLKNKIEAFYNHDAMYDAFRDKANMEKYIGPLDGQNLKRNMDFIYSLLDRPSEANN